MSTNHSQPDDRAEYELSLLVADAFAHGLTLEETVIEVTLPAMNLTIDEGTTVELVGRFYKTCLDRLSDREAIARLARMDPITSERNLASEAERLGVTKSLLRAEVRKARQNAANTRTGSNQTTGGEGVGDRSNGCSNSGPVRTEEQLYAAVKSIIEAPDVLAKVDQAIEQLGYAGDRSPVILTYSVITSRLLDKPINLHIIAPSASGKNYTVNTALALIPDEAVFKMTASTPKALIYSDQDLQHKTVHLSECDSILKLEGNAATLVRSIIEDARTDYDVVERDPETGRSFTRRISKEGPTGLITTGVRDLEFQTSTRVLNLYLSDTPEQTRRILQAEAAIASGQAIAASAEMMGAFKDFQRWLAARPSTTVIVPYAAHLAAKISAGETRMRRDFKQLLSVVKAIALLNQQHRQRDCDGRVVADHLDYAWARKLLVGTFKSIVGNGITDAIRQTVDAVPEDNEVSEADLVRALNLSKGTIHYRVNRALRGGWLQNRETRKGYAYRLARGTPLPEDDSPLPSVEDLKSDLAAFEHPADLNRYSNGAQPLGGEGEDATPFERSNANDDKEGMEL